MLSTRKSLPRYSRQSDHRKTSWPTWRDVTCSGTDMSPVHQVWPKQSCKAQWKGEEDTADIRRGGKTTSGNGQAWMFTKSQRVVENREKWRKLVVKLSVVPQRPSRLMGRRWWWWWWWWWTRKSRRWAMETKGKWLLGLLSWVSTRLNVTVFLSFFYRTFHSSSRQAGDVGRKLKAAKCW